MESWENRFLKQGYIRFYGLFEKRMPNAGSAATLPHMSYYFVTQGSEVEKIDS